MTRSLLLTAAVTLLSGTSIAQEMPISRDEVAVIKKKLVATFESLGQAQAGYAMESENYNLPTEASKGKEAGKYSVMYASASRNFGTEKAKERSSEELQKEYQKKMLEAQAKGDYQAMAKLGQEMQQKMSESQLKAVETRKEPIEVDVQFNDYGGATIDPDAVVFEKPGVIALRKVNDPSSQKGQVDVYFDPVNLKDTKQLSRVELKKPEEGLSSKITVLSITVRLSGPMAEIEAWAKRIDTKKVLSQISSGK